MLCPDLNFHFVNYNQLQILFVYPPTVIKLCLCVIFTTVIYLYLPLFNHYKMTECVCACVCVYVCTYVCTYIHMYAQFITGLRSNSMNLHQKIKHVTELLQAQMHTHNIHCTIKLSFIPNTGVKINQQFYNY